MKTTPLTLAAIFAAAALGSVGSAQPAPDASPANQAVAAMPAPNRIIYGPRLPSAQELSNAAAAQGLSIDRLEQNSDRVTVVYRSNNGQTNTVAYEVLPAANGSGTGGVTTGAITPSGTAIATTTPAPVVVGSSAPTVVYQSSPSVVYYDSPIYDPWYYYPPVAVGIGFGYYHGWGWHGGWHGGYHAWHR